MSTRVACSTWTGKSLAGVSRIGHSGKWMLRITCKKNIYKAKMS
jgi:hypothetical protein